MASEQRGSRDPLQGFTSSTASPSKENHFRENWLRVSKEIKLQRQQEKDRSTARTRSRLASMASLLKIKPFKGLANGSENPKEFLDDAQAAAEGWHMGHPTSSEWSAALQTTMIRFFGQNLSDGYCCIYAHALPSCPIASHCRQVLAHAGGVRVRASGRCGCAQVRVGSSAGGLKCGCAQAL